MKFQNYLLFFLPSLLVSSCHSDEIDDNSPVVDYPNEDFPHTHYSDYFDVVNDEGITLSYRITSLKNHTCELAIGAPGEVIIPERIWCDSLQAEFYVASIGEDAFSDYDFSHSRNPTYVQFPNSLKIVHKNAFFTATELKEIILPEGVCEVEEYAFEQMRANRISIPSTLTRISPLSFFSIPTLSIIEVHPDNPRYYAEDNVLYNKEKTTIVKFPGSKAYKYTIPNDVTTIGAYAFHDCGILQSIVIPASVTRIGKWAFLGTEKLKSYTVLATTPPTLDYPAWNTFSYEPWTGRVFATFHVRPECLDAYKNDPQWGELDLVGDAK